MTAYLDTHVVIRLAESNHSKISREAMRWMERSELRISPIVRLELEVMNEIERFVRSSASLIKQLKAELGLTVCDPFDTVVEGAVFEGWTQDPFDRLIVAQARANGSAPLITADERIQANYPRAVW